MTASILKTTEVFPGKYVTSKKDDENCEFSIHVNKEEVLNNLEGSLFFTLVVDVEIPRTLSPPVVVVAVLVVVVVAASSAWTSGLKICSNRKKLKTIFSSDLLVGIL